MRGVFAVNVEFMLMPLRAQCVKASHSSQVFDKSHRNFIRSLAFRNGQKSTFWCCRSHISPDKVNLGLIHKLHSKSRRRCRRSGQGGRAGVSSGIKDEKE